MAAHQNDAHDFDMTAHEDTWKVFNRLIVWGIVSIILVLLFLLWINWFFGRFA